ncbi:hypothetical protein CRUP_017648 [Coryphaenoides rupestris]|nr:hypothetical protein CRUP_017648 [Coryphaenoides rupestris]
MNLTLPASPPSPRVLTFPTAHLSLPLSSSLPASLSDEGTMTPDAENAVISAILPFLFLGNERDAQDLDLLLRLNVGFVVNVTTHLPLYHGSTGLVRYKRLPATDNSKQNLRQYFEEEARQTAKGVLVHCQAGVSRSATVVIAYLMKHTLMTMTDAYKYVRGRRPVVSPNLNFMGQLLEFERDLNSGVTPRILTPKTQWTGDPGVRGGGRGAGGRAEAGGGTGGWREEGGREGGV